MTVHFAARIAPSSITDAVFDDIVAGFYRAATGATSWVDALVPFQRAMAAIAVYLHGVDTVQGRVAFAHAASDMPIEAELDYLRTYHRIDPRTNLVIDRDPGVWFNCWEVFDDAFVAGDRYVSGMKLLQDRRIAEFGSLPWNELVDQRPAPSARCSFTYRTLNVIASA